MPAVRRDCLRQALLAINAEGGEAAAALPRGLSSDGEVCCPQPDPCAPDGKLLSEIIRTLKSWLIANPYELRKCRSTATAMRSLSHVIHKGRVEKNDLPGARSESTLKLSDSVVCKLLAHPKALRAVQQVALDSLGDANLRKAASFELSIVACEAHVKVVLADGANSVAASDAANEACAAAITAMQRSVVRRVPIGKCAVSIQHLIGKGGKRIEPLLTAIKAMAQRTCTRCDPSLQARVRVQLSSSEVHVAVLATPRPSSRVAAGAEAVEAAMRCLGEEAELSR